MRWLVVLDPPTGLNAETDTSLAIIRKGQELGIEVDTATIEGLFFDGYVGVAAVDQAGGERSIPLDEYTLILMRKEPPYDLAFHYAAQLLSLTTTPVVNNPSALRDYNEKLIALPFVHYMPPTLVASNPDTIIDFVKRHDGAIIKALDSFQGKSVSRISRSDYGVVDEFTAHGTQPVMVQAFLQAVFTGDKRVLMIGDRFLGAALRRPTQGYHANFANSEALKTQLSEKEQRILADVGPWLLKRGIHFSGLDFIGECLTEINITCPTGIIQASALEGRDLAAEVVDYFINLVQRHDG